MMEIISFSHTYIRGEAGLQQDWANREVLDSLRSNVHNNLSDWLIHRQNSPFFLISCMMLIFCQEVQPSNK